MKTRFSQLQWKTLKVCGGVSANCSKTTGRTTLNVSKKMVKLSHIQRCATVRECRWVAYIAAKTTQANVPSALPTSIQAYVVALQSIGWWTGAV
jgi:hypothetical protein